MACKPQLTGIQGIQLLPCLRASKVMSGLSQTSGDLLWFEVLLSLLPVLRRPGGGGLAGGLSA